MTGISALSLLSELPGDWNAEYTATLPKAQEFAQTLPFVRVVAPSNARLNTELEDIFRHGKLRKSHKSTTTIDKEKRLGRFDGLYFHGGRTHPDYGSAVFVFSDFQNKGSIEATPFGIGGLLCGGSADTLHHRGACIRPIAHESLDIQKMFVDNSAWDTNWRKRAGQYIALYFASDLKLYFAPGAIGRPNRSDPAGIFSESKNMDWRSWTIELRLDQDLDLHEALDSDLLVFWAMDSQLEEYLVEEFVDKKKECDFYKELMTRASDLRIDDPGKGKEFLLTLIDRRVVEWMKL